MTQPIVAVLTEDHALLVRYGQRRTLAAIAAERPTVPVYVMATDAQDTSSKVVRIVSQRDENTHRAGLSVAEDIAVVETLTGMGLSAAQVVKQARMKRTDADAALAVSGSTLARKATERYADLTLEQAAVVAEFSDDTDAAKALIVASADGKFDHVAQQVRDARAEKAGTAAVLADLDAKGSPSWSRSPTTTPPPSDSTASPTTPRPAPRSPSRTAPRALATSRG